MMILSLVLTALLCQLSVALDNGVARTPPMGWIHWERFECNTQCDMDPDNCISERLFQQQADAAVAGGFRDAGYTIIAMDDCWAAKDRDSSGRIAPNAQRFPSGMKALGDYMHTRGLQFGVYGDVGTRTCAGFPGTEDHWQTDADTFADWGVDFLKFDACNSDIPKFHVGFPAMKQALNQTGRHIIYSCEWPMYEKAQGGHPDYHQIADTCNVFRQLTDIYDSWGSVIGMIEYFGDDPGNFSQVAGPGSWNDPDQVVIGNFGLSEGQERVQMALYAILASPMFMSNDLRHIRDSSKAILLNKAVIAVNQDPLGIQGKRVKYLSDKLSVWTRPVVPSGSFAIAFLFTQEYGGPIRVSIPLSSIGLNNTGGYDIKELFDGKDMGQLRPSDNITCFVNPTGVVMLKATVLGGGKQVMKGSMKKGEEGEVKMKVVEMGKSKGPNRWEKLWEEIREGSFKKVEREDAKVKVVEIGTREGPNTWEKLWADRKEGLIKKGEGDEVKVNVQQEMGKREGRNRWRRIWEERRRLRTERNGAVIRMTAIDRL